MQTYNSDETRAILFNLPDQNYVMFAWACLARIEIFFKDFAEKSGRCRPDLVCGARLSIANEWLHQRNHDRAIVDLLPEFDRLVPESEPSEYAPGETIFEDVAACAAYMCESSLNSDLGAALAVGNRLFDIADRLEADEDIFTVTNEFPILGVGRFSIIETELARQRRDLKNLLKVRTEHDRRVFILEYPDEQIVDSMNISR